MLKCIFVENDPKSSSDLERFCSPFIDFEIIPRDINDQIINIMGKIKSNPVFFFVDPYRLKDLDCETVKLIISKNGPIDMILNYICGTNRVIAAIKELIKRKESKNITIKYIESIKRLHTLPILEKTLDKTEKVRLTEWAAEIFKNSKLNNRALFEMLSSSKNEPVYYLLFASKNETAKKIIDYIYEIEDRETPTGQRKLIFS